MRANLLTKNSLIKRCFPILRNIAKPWNTRRLEGHGGVKATGDCTVDDDLLLFVEQRNHLALCTDGFFQLPVRPVQKTYYCGLLNGKDISSSVRSGCGL